MKSSNKLIILLALLTLTGCESESSIVSSLVSSTPIASSSSEQQFVSFDKQVLNVENRGFVTGKDSPVNTFEMGVGGCDLGYPVYIPEKDETYFFFGDTFSNQNQSGNWRSNVIGISSDTNYDDGLSMEDFIRTPGGMITYAINGHHNTDGINEVTKIPTGIIDLDGTIYMFYFSMFDWSLPDDNKMNYGGCVKSTDFGNSWERVYDLTWVNPDCRNSRDNIEGLINEDANNFPDVGTINIDDHNGVDATQIYPVDGKDGYVYLFLEGGYRNRGPKLARVRKENIEIFSEYEYFIGQYDDQGNAKYKKGKNGLAYIAGKSSTRLVTHPFGEMCAFYNAYLKKWCIMTVSGASVIMCTADKPDGPYNTTINIFPSAATAYGILPVGSLYAPLTCEHMQEEGGKVMYMLLSTWMPFYNPSFIKVTFK